MNRTYFSMALLVDWDWTGNGGTGQRSGPRQRDSPTVDGDGVWRTGRRPRSEGRGEVVGQLGHRKVATVSNRRKLAGFGLASHTSLGKRLPKHACLCDIMDVVYIHIQYVPLWSMQVMSCHTCMYVSVCMCVFQCFIVTTWRLGQGLRL